MDNQFLYINSADLLQGNSSDFLIDLQDIDLSAQRTAIGIQSIIFPNVYYNVNEFNNNIAINVSGVDYTFTLTPGNYSITDFTGAFNADISSVVGEQIRITQDSITGKFVYTAATTDFTINVSKKQKYLGLSEGIHSSSSLVLSGDTIPDFSGTNFYDILLDNIGLFSVNTAGYNRNILTRIYNDKSFGEYINNPLSFFTQIKIYENTKFNIPVRISVVDENNDPVDLKGLNWSITLFFSDQYS
jgi:hypothetical protein